MKVDLGLGDLKDDEILSGESLQKNPKKSWHTFLHGVFCFSTRNLRIASAVPSTFAPDGSSSFEALGSKLAEINQVDHLSIV